ncbi:MAG: cation transporter [Lentisphaeria bacterium]|nr:cation transporter [Lentisphaeria bacterium]
MVRQATAAGHIEAAGVQGIQTVQTKPLNPPAYQSEVQRVTRAGLLLNVVLGAVKAVVGVAGNSQACLADAAHSLSDCVTDVAILVGVGFWMAPADDSHPHGHRRIEALVTVFIGAVLAAAAIGLGWRALATVGQEHAHPPGWPVFVVATASVLLKEALYRWTARVGARIHAPAVIANAWHHRSDALSSIPVAASILIAKAWPAVDDADHIAAILVAGMLLHAAWTIVWPCLQELTDRGAGAAVHRRILERAAATPDVRDVHQLRSRRIGPGYAIDLHVLVDPAMSVRDGHAVCDRVRDAVLADEPRVVDILVHLEPFEEAAGEAAAAGREGGRVREEAGGPHRHPATRSGRSAATPTPRARGEL